MGLGIDPNGGNTSDYSKQLQAKGLSKEQIQCLDELDGDNQNGIRKDIFTIANSIIDGIPFEDTPNQKSAQTAFAVSQILRMPQDGTNGLTMYIKPEDAMKDLGISADQAGELAKLGNQDSSKGIQRGFYQIAEQIISGKPIMDPSGTMKPRIDAVAAILQGNSSALYATEDE